MAALDNDTVTGSKELHWKSDDKIGPNEEVVYLILTKLIDPGSTLIQVGAYGPKCLNRINVLNKN